MSRRTFTTFQGICCRKKKEPLPERAVQVLVSVLQSCNCREKGRSFDRTLVSKTQSMLGAAREARRANRRHGRPAPTTTCSKAQTYKDFPFRGRGLAYQQAFAHSEKYQILDAQRVKGRAQIQDSGYLPHVSYL